MVDARNVIAGSADQQVCPAPAIEPIIAIAAIKRIRICVGSVPLAAPQRVIAGPADQAVAAFITGDVVIAIAAIQRVIASAAIEELTIAVTECQEIIARCAIHEQDFLQNELVTPKALLSRWACKVKN